ncbi:gem-associated protein 8-like [Ptychodera flava]|uniref:gem-associated protein 8-like n=1 Tax=Ptychodera flava TaxID=63121 RepID=UPI00396A0CD1
MKMDEPGNIPAPAMEFHSSPGQPWHQDPRFHRYWQHYHNVWEWYYTNWFPTLSVMQQRHFTQYDSGIPLDIVSDHNASSYWVRNSMQRQHPHSVWDPSTFPPANDDDLANKQDFMSDESEETDSESESCNVSEDSQDMEMEVSQEMKEFFAKSEQHREQRKKEIEDLKQKIFSGKEQDYINAEDMYKSSVSTSHEAPTERPGQRRRTEMKMLYGEDAAMIHGMETALQLQFDRNYDRKQPKLWPTIPFKL